ncbi:phage tail tape measure protein [uncultured Tissierella sp.]|uniref:phage tail tape measure protein n=1 Tax=uncultured Tissierella sp. TaxID=448160 RepID=UPI002803EAFB|nr:phage tail tape measure protein [uncultured Tissierella sp.]MDU5081223.1 phage tail tape measure protein [Bacillota bacterium]
MNDENAIKIMQSLGLDYNPAITSTVKFEKVVVDLNKELAQFKANAMKSAKDINNVFSSQLGQVLGNKSIVDQYGNAFKTAQAEANKMKYTLKDNIEIMKQSTLEQMKAQAASIQHRASAKGLSEEYSKQAGTLREQLSVIQSRLQAEGKLSAEEVKQTQQLKEQLDILKAQTRTEIADQGPNILDSEYQRRSSWFLSGSLFYGAMKGAKEAISTISEVEMGMVEISRVMEDATFVFKDYRDELLQLGVDYGQTFETVQDIALRWAQAGYGVRDSLDNTKTSLLALNTAELDAKNSTESLIGIMDQWKLTSADLPLLLDKINKIADDYTVSSQDLIDGLLKSSEVSRDFGLTLDQNIALLTVMREASGATGKEIGNALKSILVFTQRDKSIDVLKSLGISSFTDELETNFRPAWEIFQDISSKWDSASKDIQDGFVKAADDAGLLSGEITELIGMGETWTDVQKRDIAQGAAGAYRRNYFISLIKRLADAQGVLNNMMDAAGYSQSENARTMDTLEKKYQSLKTSAEQLAVALGDAGLLDILKDITDKAIDVTQGLTDIDEEGRALIITALELLAAVKAIKSVGGMFGVDATLGAAISVLPGWTKLLAIIPAVAGAIGLYAYNLNSATDVTNGLRDKQEELTKSFNSQIEAARETEKSLLEQAKTSETLANKLVELNEKENINMSEKAQLKDIADKLNTSFSNLGLEIDANTGKVIGNTQAIFDNISALKQQAIAQGYQTKMQATASAYVDQESLLGQTRNELDIAKAELNSLKLESNQALREIEQTRANASKNSWSNDTLGRTIVGINKKYGLTNIEQQIKEREKQINALYGLASEQEKLLSELDAELSDWADKAIETSSNLSDSNKYVPNVREAKPTSTKSTKSKKYENEALANALKILDYKKYINELTIEDEIATLNQIKSKYVITSDELIDINKRIYSAEKSLINERLKNSINWINEKKNLNELSAEEEIAAWERVRKNQSNNIEAVKQATLNLYKLRNQVITDSFSREENSIKHLTKLGILSVEEQIKKYRELYEVKAPTLAEEQSRVENLFDLYKKQISDQQRTIKEAHDKRIEQIEEEAKKKKSIHEDEIKAIEKELELLNRQEDEYDHDKKMADLKEQLAYWQVRTSEDARKKVSELLKQIDEAEHKREVDLKKQSLEDKKKVLQDEVKSVEDTAREEREKLDKSYKQIEIAFDEHSINLIALASTMSKGMFEEFQKNYLIPLENALRNADYGSVDNILGGVDDFAKDAYDKTYNSNNAQIYRLASSIVDLKKQYEYGGDKSAAQRAVSLYDELTRFKPNVADSLHRMNYMQAQEYVKNLPKMHKGGKSLSYGAVEMMPGELAFPPDLSTKLESLIEVLYARPISQSSSKSFANNRKEIKIDKLLNIERNYMEDDVDSSILARELQRQLSSIM